MAQKTNPISLRLKRTNKLWDSCWYGDYNYTLQLKQDCGMRAHIQNICQQAKIAEPVVFIKRARQQVRTLFVMPKRQPFGGRVFQQKAGAKQGKRGGILSVPRPLWTTPLLPLTSKATNPPAPGIGSPAFSGMGLQRARKSSAEITFPRFPRVDESVRNTPVSYFPKGNAQGAVSFLGKEEKKRVAFALHERAEKDWFCKIFSPKTVSALSCALWPTQTGGLQNRPLFSGKQVEGQNTKTGPTLFPYLLLSLFTGVGLNRNCLCPKDKEESGGGDFSFSQGATSLISGENKEKAILSIYALAVTMLSVSSGRWFAKKEDYPLDEWIWDKMRQVPHPTFPVARKGVANHGGEAGLSQREKLPHSFLSSEQIAFPSGTAKHKKEMVSNQPSTCAQGAYPFYPAHTSEEKGVSQKNKQAISTILPQGQVASRVALKNHLETFLFQQVQGGCKVHYLVCPSAHQNPLFLASQIVFSLQERVPFRRLKHRIMRECSKDQRIKGVRINCSGRVATRSKKAQKARSESIQWGQTSLNVFSDFVHFASKAALTPFGKIGVKVWICYK